LRRWRELLKVFASDEQSPSAFEEQTTLGGPSSSVEAQFNLFFNTIIKSYSLDFRPLAGIFQILIAENIPDRIWRAKYTRITNDIFVEDESLIARKTGHRPAPADSLLRAFAKSIKNPNHIGQPVDDPSLSCTSQLWNAKACGSIESNSTLSRSEMSQYE